MTISKCVGQLINVLGRPGLLESFQWLLSKHLVHFSSGSEFQYEIHSSLVIKVSEEAKNVWMSEMTLNFNFPPELMFDGGLLQLRLEEHLESHDVFGLLFSGQIHIAKFALAQRASNVKVVKRPSVVRAAFRVITTVRI